MRVFLTATALILMIAPAALLLADPPEDAAAEPIQAQEPAEPAAPEPPATPSEPAKVIVTRPKRFVPRPDSEVAVGAGGTAAIVPAQAAAPPSGIAPLPPTAPLPTFPRPTTVQGQAVLPANSPRAVTQWPGQAPAAAFLSQTPMVPIQVWDGEKLQTIYRPQTIERLDAVQGYPLRYGFTEPDPRDQQARELAMKFRQTKDKTQQAELREELLKLTEESFKAKLDARREEIAAVEKQLATMKERVDQREKLADEIIERRVATLLDEPDPLDWDDQQPATGYSNPIGFNYYGSRDNQNAARLPNSAPSLPNTNSPPLRLNASAPVLPAAPPVNVRGIASGEEKEIEVPSLSELEKRYIQLIRQVSELQSVREAISASNKDPLVKSTELLDLDQRLKTLRSALADLTARTMLKFEFEETSEENTNRLNDE